MSVNELVTSRVRNPPAPLFDILTQIMKDYKLGQSTILKIYRYIEKPNLQNEKGLEKYIDMILTEKAEKK